MKRLTAEFINLAKAGAPKITAAARLAAWHYAQGRRVLLLAPDQLCAEELDRALWTFEQNSFVPHEQAGGIDQEQEPVLIATSPQNLNRASVLIMLKPLEPEEAPGYLHLVYFVPGEEGEELVETRERYKRLKGDPGINLVHSTSLPMY